MTALQGRVDSLFEFNQFATTPTLIARDHHFGFARLNPGSQRLGGKAAEYHAVHRSNARTRQHGHYCIETSGHTILGQHGPKFVALVNTELVQLIICGELLREQAQLGKYKIVLKSVCACDYVNCVSLEFLLIGLEALIEVRSTAKI
ncbi:hypothetical protein BpHYR1_054684 [Brachionus plicatilis]|uniref:Uncharacterized protein n=1 Tax=Brachionus plicatilis TaxID=10195 RepID=A0A3M7SIV1_BRAPC|nr:hypothetical protein BpHYR1_054684 [Brachionus plicatilis]